MILGFLLSICIRICANVIPAAIRRVNVYKIVNITDKYHIIYHIYGKIISVTQ